MKPIRILACVFAVAAAVGAAAFWPVQASSHREAPLISADPLADNTDLYAFVSPSTPDKVTIIANFIPLEAPYGGPNFYKFDDNVVYAIKIDNNGDAREDVTFQFQFKTSVRNGNTFLYNTGPIDSLDSLNFNVRQSYTVTRLNGNGGFGGNKSSVLGKDLPTPPVNVGVRSTPNYENLAAAAVRDLPGGIRVFAGQRDDPFFVDLNVFDLLAVPPADTDNKDSLAGYNVHTIAIEIPIASLTANGMRPANASDPNAVIGIWSTASRPSITNRKDGEEKAVGTMVQVSRLGQPLVNEVVIPRAAKDLFNSLQPTEDAAALPFVQDPEVPKLLSLLFGIQSPAAPRNDLVTIFLTGIPGLNQPPNVKPSEMLRLNTAIAPVFNPNPLGVLGGDVAGFPNGRRLTDDVVDIALRAMAGATPLTPSFNGGINAQLGDGVGANDKPFLLVFPYVATPHAGNK
ncbi:MAG TPA: DUF4331 domain-containing protein [Vicinamibacterales bacterium]|nr:DUF4331 domain-containing protein [Vicinamibacterales bacterium]